MFGKIISADVRGIEGYGVSVEADISEGMPVFLMVGYLASEVREAADRVRTALKNCGIPMPARRITVNLAPAGVRKSGSRFDLPVAAALLTAMGYLDQERLENIMIAGELSLNGEIHGVPGILPMVEAAKELGCRYCIVPEKNAREGSMIPGIGIVGVRHLKELAELLGTSLGEGGLLQRQTPAAELEKRCINGGQARAELLETPDYTLDFAEINGQDTVKRAAQVAVAGMHNLLLMGPPGAGKTMIARRIPTILPPMSLKESMELSKIYSIAGMLSDKEPLLRRRPFRAPHHTVSTAALTGGGRIPVPGEISLASNGILFLDELPEFRKSVLEILRQPLEEGEVRISRSYGTYVYPARFMLVAAMNPCSCGYFPDLNICTCAPGDVARYLGRLSRPLLDRIDICIEAPRISYGELTGSREGNETSAAIRERMTRVHRLQQERYRDTDYRFNCDLNGAGIERFCSLGKKERQLLKDAFERFHLSARAYHRIIKVARTIADLEEEPEIRSGHLMEAICYRTMDKKFWGR